MPLQRRLPKRGFTNIFRKQYVWVNLKELEGFEAGAEISPEVLRARGTIKRLGDGLKVLADGELKVPLHISAHAFSKSALDKIQKAGGTARVLRHD